MMMMPALARLAPLPGMIEVSALAQPAPLPGKKVQSLEPLQCNAKQDDHVTKWAATVEEPALALFVPLQGMVTSALARVVPLPVMMMPALVGLVPLP